MVNIVHMFDYICAFNTLHLGAVCVMFPISICET